MSPPPRPPIICYDITSNGTVCRRRIEPMSSIRSRKPITPTVTYKSYVPPTIIANSPKAKRYSTSLTSNNATHDGRRKTSPIKLSTTNRIRTSYPTSCFATSQRSTATNHVSSTAPASQYNTDCRSYRANEISSVCKHNDDINNNDRNSLLYNKHSNVNARQAYGQKLRDQTEQKERQRHHELHHKAMVDKLEQIQAQLNELQKNHNMLSSTYGMAHNAADYFKRQDEEHAKLRQKVDQIAETRAKEITRQTQRARKYHQLLEDKDKLNDEERLKDISNVHHSRCNQKHRVHVSPVKSHILNNSLSSTSSPTTITTSNSQGSSSTISLSSCPSPMSTSDDQLDAQMPQQQQHSSNIHHKSQNNTSHLVKSTQHVSFSTPPSRLPKYGMYRRQDPYPNDTLEVTDMEFFAKVEDQTMIEANNLMNRLQSTFKDFNDIL